MLLTLTLPQLQRLKSRVVTHFSSSFYSFLFCFCFFFFLFFFVYKYLILWASSRSKRKADGQKVRPIFSRTAVEIEFDTICKIQPPKTHPIRCECTRQASQTRRASAESRSPPTSTCTSLPNKFPLRITNRILFHFIRLKINTFGHRRLQYK